MASTKDQTRSHRDITTASSTASSGSSSVNLEEAEEGGSSSYGQDEGGIWKALESAKSTLQQNAHEYFTETQSLQREQMQ